MEELKTKTCIELTLYLKWIKLLGTSKDITIEEFKKNDGKGNAKYFEWSHKQQIEFLWKE